MQTDEVRHQIRVLEGNMMGYVCKAVLLLLGLVALRVTSLAQGNPGPSITSLLPPTAVAGGAAFTLTVNGTGFAIGDVVNWNGTWMPTTFVSPSQLQTSIGVSQISSVATANVSVSSATTLLVSQSGIWGAGVATTDLSAPNQSWSYSFVTNARPQVGNETDGQSFLWSLGTAIKYTLNGNAVGIAGANISFYNGTVGGGMSVDLVHGNSTVLLIAQSPSSPVQFYSGPESNPVIQPVSYAGPTTAYAYLPSGQAPSPTQTIAGNLDITLIEEGATTAAVSFAINPISGPDITLLTPSSIPALSPPFTLMIAGSGFADGAVAQWTQNGQTTHLATQLASASSLTALVPASLLTTPWSRVLITVVNPGGAASVPRSLTVEAAPGGAPPGQLITTVAGSNFAFPPTPVAALHAPLGAVQGLAVDPTGNLYAADPSNNIVTKISPNGSLTVVAGNGVAGFSGDGGAAASAALNEPYGVVLDAIGNIYIADSENCRVRKVDASGIIWTIAGGDACGFSGDGAPAIGALLAYPRGLAVDLHGNLYIADTSNLRVRRVAPDGTISTIAGVGYGIPVFDQGGPATSADLGFPTGVATDAAGNLYITNSDGYNLFKVTPAGTITEIAGLNTGIDVRSSAVAVDPSGNLYLVDEYANVIKELTPAGVLTAIAGNGSGGFSGDGAAATSASLNGPASVVSDAAGNLYISDSLNQRIRKVTPSGIVDTVAGNGSFSFSGSGGPAVSAALDGPQGIGVDPKGGYYVADFGANRVVKVSSSGIITIVAGTGVPSFAGDGGPATSASFNFPDSVVVDSLRNVYIADLLNGRIRKIDSNGIISTFAGVGTGGGSEADGVATSVALSPSGLAIDSADNIYLISSGIRKVTPSGMLTTVVGDSQPGFSGDGGLAKNAAVSPQSLAVDKAGNIYIADAYNYRIRKVTPDGFITTIAGNGTAAVSGDGGQAISAGLGFPIGLATDAEGNLYASISDSQSRDCTGSRVRRIGIDGIITTVAGDGVKGFSGDGGLATNAMLSCPSGLAVDVAGNLLIADTGNHRVREIPAVPPLMTVSTASMSFSANSMGAPPPAQSFSISSVPGLGFSLTVVTTGGNWLFVTPQSGAAPRLIDVVADPSTLTSQGTYSGNITIATPDGNPAITTVNVTFQVSAAQPATLAPLDPRSLSFAFAKSSPAQSQRLTISNSGGGILNFTAAASVATPTGAQWLTLSQATGQVSAASPATLTITADPTGLGPGTFTGTVSVTAGSTTHSVPVTITVSASSQAILLSQRGLFFTAVAQGGVIPPQTFAVLNIGTGVVGWTAKAIAIPASPAWFSVSPTSGSTDASQSPPVVTVTVDPSKLAVAGTYYGLVQVDAPNAANSPQVLTVVLKLLAAGSDTGAALTPGSLLFSTVAGASSPGSQNVLAYNITANAKSFRSVVSADPGLSIVTLPTDATLDPQSPTSIVVQPFTTALAAGVYTGVVTLQFDDGRVIPLTVKVIVASTSETSSSVVPGSNIRTGKLAEAGPCTPTKLQPILTAPNSAFTGLTGFGVKLGVFVEDDCGNPLQSGSVKVRFSNGDTTSTLQPLQGGLWEGTWYTQNPSTSINLTVQATNSQGISGSLQTNGSLASDTPPVFDEAHIFSAFGATQFLPLAPGEVITIYGTVLAEPGASLAAPPPPLSTTLVDTTVTVAGIPLPLYYVSDTQVNAVVPYALSSNSLNAPLQILVQRGNTLSQPVYVTVATAEPAVLGTPGTITDYPSNYPANPYYTVSASMPAHAGDTILLYCLGLGAVTPPVADGGLPTGISDAAPIKMMIGDQTATVSYQVLSPQFPGLYQVTAVIPSGVTTGNSVPVTITAGGQTSPPIQLPVQ